AYRILCVRFACFVRHSLDSATDATLDTGGGLALTRRGLSPREIRQASLGAITPRLSGARRPCQQSKTTLFRASAATESWLRISVLQELVYLIRRVNDETIKAVSANLLAM
ncbi:MAG: hypothetical protein ACREXY_13230, partial [Gammaproteobacteria bacterium]